MNKYLLLLTFCILSISLLAQQSADKAIMVSVNIDASNEEIEMKWSPLSGVSSIKVYRKEVLSISWTIVANLTASDTIFTDTNIQKGVGYEYRLNGVGSVPKNQYLYAGIEIEPVHSRGIMLLIIDSVYVKPLKAEINLLISDLTGDGWQVIKHPVSRTQNVTGIKSWINSTSLAHSGNVKGVFLLGHVPVPYSGNNAYDGHTNHQGAWPADVYYSDLTGTYTDNSINNITPSRQENKNIPGDGKFDQTYLPGKSEFQLGRVDLYNLPYFPESDTLLLKRYLAKNHLYKHKMIVPAKRAVIDDNFGYFSGEAFAASGWRNFSALVGPDSITVDDYFTSMQSDSYLWSYGCGGGSYSSCSGIGTTNDFVNDSLKNVFTMLFGSYFGDWDSPNNLLRAPLASKGWCLANAWSGRPYWAFHHMGLGETIGFSTMKTQNNTTIYDGNYFRGAVHIGLMGDPSLRMDIDEPPSGLIATNTIYNSAVQLNWQAPAFGCLGYYVYRAKSLLDSFQLVTPGHLTSTSFIDYPPDTGQHIYMVRAVSLENSTTGSYYNLSQGIFDSASTTVINSVVSVENSHSFKLYPNPATEKIIVEVSEIDCQHLDIEIFDLAGRLMIDLSDGVSSEKYSQEIDISSLTSGVYLILVKGSNINLLQKFIKY